MRAMQRRLGLAAFGTLSSGGMVAVAADLFVNGNSIFLIGALSAASATIVTVGSIEAMQNRKHYVAKPWAPLAFVWTAWVFGFVFIVSILVFQMRDNFAILKSTNLPNWLRICGSLAPYFGIGVLTPLSFLAFLFCWIVVGKAERRIRTGG